MVKFLYFLIACFLIKISYIDWKTKYIWDADVFWVLLVALVVNLFQEKHTVPGLEGWSMALFIAFVIHFVTFKIYGKEVFGSGDALLLGAIGMILGWPVFVDYFIFSSEIGGLIAAIVVLWKRSLNPDIYLPLAPIYTFSLGLFVWLGKPSVISLILSKM